MSSGTVRVVDVGRAVRDARRSRGLDQRGLAAAAGVSSRTVASVESDSAHRPSLPVLEALLAACGLELTVTEAAPPAEVCTHLRPHLRLSLSRRWAVAADGTGRAADLQDALSAAGWRGLLVLEPRAAVPLWVPGAGLELPVVVRVHRPWDGTPLREPPVDPDLVVIRPGPATMPVGQVHVRVGNGRDLHALPPDALAGDTCCRPWRPALLAAARLLHEEGERDAAGRRPPPHRQPDEDEEARRLSQALRYVRTARPSALDSRAHRLDAPVSLPQWLERKGLPPLRGQRRSSGRRW